MRIFLDSTSIDEVQRAAQTGFLAGVTTNPYLLSKAPDVGIDDLKKIASLVEGPFNLQVMADTEDEMIKQGEYFAKLTPNMVIKVPLTGPGLGACRRLSAQKIPVNVTLCFSVVQALLAAQAGATYVSPFMGRLEAEGKDALQLIEDIRVLYDMYGFETEILAASIRSVAHVEGAALRGADIATCPGAIFWKLHEHDLTDKGLAVMAPEYPELKNRLLP